MFISNFNVKAIFYLYIIRATGKVILNTFKGKKIFNATPSKHTIESLVIHAELALQAFRLFFPSSGNYVHCSNPEQLIRQKWGFTYRIQIKLRRDNFYDNVVSQEKLQ